MGTFVPRSENTEERKVPEPYKQAYKSMADSRREMLAKCQRSGSMTVTVDDTESAADTPTPTGKKQCSSLVASARCLQTAQNVDV